MNCLLGFKAISHNNCVRRRTASYSYTYNSLSKGTYRTKVTAKVYCGKKYETVTAYSSSVSC